MAQLNFFTVVIQETEPTNPQMFWLWLQLSGQAWIYILGWIPIGGSDAFTAMNGIFQRQQYNQTSEPSSPDKGDMWLDDNGQNFLNMSIWTPIVGG